tara:strand:- start:756 stop:2480 length:1725 start_codon:yes stop_codon:yes gene_type:complete
MNKFKILLIPSFFILFSCTSSNENDIFESYLDKEWEKTLQENPIFATYTGDKRFNTEISSNSIDEYLNDKDSMQDSLTTLNKIDVNKLNEDNKLNYKLYLFELKRSIESKKFSTYCYRLNQRGGIQSFYETGDRLVYTSNQDYLDWYARLEKFSDNIKTSLDVNKKCLEDGITQPKNIVRGVIAQIDAILDSKIDNNPYYKIFSDIEDDYLKKSVKELIINKINPAYKDLNNFLKNEYLINSRNTIGVSDVPNGKDYYEFLAKKFTTTDLTPDEIHEIGWDELRRIRSEMEQIISDLNWDGDFSSFLNYLRTDPQFYYDNPEDLFNAYLIMSKTIDPLLPKIFKIFPRAPYGVIPIPDESAPFTTTAYYNRPSPGRPGYFYANLYKPESRPKYEIPVLTVHEAVPGHHFQISIAQELENVPEFRKHGGITAFVEGWGLYSEELGEHINLYDDPYDKFGQLTYDMWRAIRLVVDTGMHYKDWTRDEAIDLFIKNSAKSLLDIENEVDRYIAWPGQALAYKIGQLKILELRNRAESMLGDKYDIKDFHHEVLKRGSLPLELLEFYIDEWINETLDS